MTMSALLVAVVGWACAPSTSHTHAVMPTLSQAFARPALRCASLRMAGGPSRPGDGPSRPGELVDTDGDGRPDAIALDTVGDGEVDATVDLADALPYQAAAQRLLVHPAFEAASALASLALLVTFGLGERGADAAALEALNALEVGFSAFFLVEFLLRWYAVGGSARYLATPLALIDALNIAPLAVALSSPSSLSMTASDSPLAALCLFRAARVLRLRRFF
jgi:hypothetical protein